MKLTFTLQYWKDNADPLRYMIVSLHEDTVYICRESLNVFESEHSTMPWAEFEAKVEAGDYRKLTKADKAELLKSDHEELGLSHWVFTGKGTLIRTDGLRVVTEGSPRTPTMHVIRDGEEIEVFNPYEVTENDDWASRLESPPTTLDPLHYVDAKYPMGG